MTLIAAIPAYFAGRALWPRHSSDAPLLSVSAAELAKMKAAYKRPENIPFPSNNPYTDTKYELGKILFFDPRLSGSNVTSCATCHNPSLSWSDGLRKGVGFGHKSLPRRTPTLLNVAWGWSYFWDGRADTLEQQALGPIQAPAEMNMKLTELVERLRAIRGYRPLFANAFPGQAISGETIGKAIATFERTIVSDVAPFDRWIAGKPRAISVSAQRGFVLFNTKGECAKCHSGWNFTNGMFADTGLPDSDRGRGAVTGDAPLDFTFKTPTLRNIARHAPYMHDGSLTNLRDVIELYDQGGIAQRAGTRLFLKPLHLTAQEKKDLVSFLETLTSRDESVRLPSLPRGEWEEESWKKILSTR